MGRSVMQEDKESLVGAIKRTPGMIRERTKLRATSAW